MRKQSYKIVAIILTFICIVLSIVLIAMKTYAFVNNSKENDINEKVISEVKFIDENIIDAMNKLNNITITRYKVYTKSINKPEEETQDTNASKESKESNSSNESGEEEQSKNNSETKKSAETNSEQMNVSELVINNSLTETMNENINWDEISYIYENLYSAWPTINIDLKTVGINEENITSFSLGLNGVAQAINAKDKESALVNFYNLYAKIPNYISMVEKDSFEIIKYNTKLEVLNAYTLANQDNKWQEMNETISKAKENFVQMYNILDKSDNRRLNIEKTNTILSDLENCIILNDKNIFFMQYKKTIQALETL